MFRLLKGSCMIIKCGSGFNNDYDARVTRQTLKTKILKRKALISLYNL